MIDHVYISVTDVDKSLAFYLAALEPLGWRAFGNYDAASGPHGVPDLFGLGDHAYVSGTGIGSSIWLRRRGKLRAPILKKIRLLKASRNTPARITSVIISKTLVSVSIGMPKKSVI